MIKFQINRTNSRASRDRNSGKRGDLTSRIGKIGQQTLFAIVVTMSCAIAAPVKAAERLTLRLGPFQQSVEIGDLEKFAETGKLSPTLKPYRSLLTPEIQQLLNRRLQIDPKVTEKFVNDLLRSSDGIRVLDQISLALPNSSIEELKAALMLAARQANGFSVLSFLRSYPEDDVVVDASAAIAIVLQLNTPYLESIALAPLLEQEMTTTDDTPFQFSFDAATGGKESVYERTVRLRDEERQRTILVDLYWADRASGPLVILSHGFASDRKFLTYLARHLASSGFTVASVEHPGSNFSAINGGGIGTNFETVLPPTEFIDRPLDVSFVLNELAQMNRGYGSLRDKLNTEHVTVIGHSLGGYTALALAGGKLDLEDLREFCKNRSPLRRAPADWFQCAATKLSDDSIQLEDKRVVQAIAFNPVTGRLFGKKGLAQVTVPTLILTGTADTITPSLDHQLRPFAQLGGSKYLIAAIGGTHLSVTDPGNLNDALAQSTLVKELTGKEAEPLRELLRGVSLAFVKQLTPEAKLYEPFLTPAYAEFLSTSTLKLRMNTQLPPTIGSWLEVMTLPNRQIALRLPKVNEWFIGGIRWPFSPSTQVVTKAELNEIFTNLLNHYNEG